MLFTISSLQEVNTYFQVVGNTLYASAANVFSANEELIVTFARTGDKGDLGYQGLKGDTGEQGIQGVQGKTGANGDRGEQGL